MTPYPQPYPMRPPPKKGMSGCAIAAIVVGIIALVGTIVVAVAIYLVVTSDAGKTAIKVVGDTKKMAEKAANAPGTPELRALGCDKAIVLDTKDVGEIMSDLIDGGFDAGVPNSLMVACEVRDASRAPKCEDVASTYVRAVKTPSSSFVVSVKRESDSADLCEQTYDTTGALVGSGMVTSPRGTASSPRR